jgi:hypothetical protein
MANAASRNLRPFTDSRPRSAFGSPERLPLKGLSSDTRSKSALQKFPVRLKMNITACRGIVASGTIAELSRRQGCHGNGRRTRGRRRVPAGISRADRRGPDPVPAGWRANFCPRHVERSSLVAEELRHRELVALLVSVKGGLTTRIPCPKSQP